MNHPKIAILASGSGTTAEAFILAGVNGSIKTKVELIICSNKSAGIFDRIEKLNSQHNLNITCIYIGKENYPDPKDEEEALLNMLSNSNVDAIVLMGYMKKIRPKVVETFGWRSSFTSPYQAKMLNTHPGLLPETAGLYGRNVQEHVINKRLPFSGQTLHIVSENYDEGPIVAEHKVLVAPDDDADTLFAKVQKIEKEHLPKDVDKFIETRLQYLKGEIS